MSNEEVRKDDKRDPYREKQLDYKHQKRSAEGGEGWHKTRARLPRLERRRYRYAQEHITKQALTDDEMELAAGDAVRATRRAAFNELHSRRDIPLGKFLKLASRQYRLLAGRKKGRDQ